MNDTRLPTAEDVDAAAARLAPVVRQTPLLESDRLNDRLGGRLLIKPECLQRTGSFKFRGAYNRISQLDDAAKKRGVVAFSSGNHAQGVAAAARMLGVSATIVMPSDAPAIKIANTKADGATVVPYERADANRAEIARKLVAETGATLVPPYDDPHIIAGQGTVGRETAGQAAELGIQFDVFLAPCSGGGLISGCALAFSAASPTTEIYSVEPEGFDDTARSLASGERQEIEPGAASICDALLVETPGDITFAINQRLLTGGLAVSDDETRRAMQVIFQEFKLAAEPSGATALAAVLEGRIEAKGRTIAVVISGGNVDAATYRQMIN